MATVTLIIAHRGASFAEPENTIDAFRRAVVMGADGVELDVRRTADDRLVVHHDAHLPDGRVVRETPVAELPERIPTLAAALDACDGVFVNIEIKNDPADPDFDPGEWVMHRTATELAVRGGGRRWLISSFRRETVEVCRRVLPSARAAWLVVDAGMAVLQRCADEGYDAVHPWAERLDADTIAAAHRLGLAVNTWTCDDPDRIGELMALGVDGICTNRPDVALSIRRSLADSV